MNRRIRLLWLGIPLALVLIPALARPQTSSSLLARWTGLGPAPVSTWKRDIGKSAYWLAAHPTDSTISCGNVKTEVMRALNGGDTWYVGVDKVSNRLGTHYTPQHEVVVDSSLSIDLQLGTVIHEAMHHAGYGNSGPDNNDDFISCFTQGREDGKEDDEDGNDGNSSGGGGGGPRIVSKVPHGNIPSVWVIVYVPRSSSGSAELGEITVVCDYDDETSWPDCPDAEGKSN